MIVVPFPATREALARLTRQAQLEPDPAKARALLALTDREAVAQWAAAAREAREEGAGK